MKKIEKRKPPPCARRAAARPRAKIAPLFWWGFLRGFLVVSRRRSECFRASVSARFLVMPKNSGGYFSITNFFDGLARSARVLALSVCLSAYRLPLSRRSCRLCGVLLCGVCVCLFAPVSSLVGLFLAVLRGCTVSALVLRSIVARSFARCGSFAWSVVCFPARVAFVRLKAFFGVLRRCF